MEATKEDDNSHICQTFLGSRLCDKCGDHLAIALLSVYLLIFLVFTATSSLLAYGTRKASPALIIPWLVGTGITGLFITSHVVTVWCYSYTSTPTTPKAGAILLSGFVLVLVLGLGLGAYLWICVYSHWKELLRSGFGGSSNGYRST